MERRWLKALSRAAPKWTKVAVTGSMRMSSPQIPKRAAVSAVVTSHNLGQLTAVIETRLRGIQ
jgi:hypothetical protein